MEKIILSVVKAILQGGFLFYLIYLYELEWMMMGYYIGYCFTIEIIINKLNYLRSKV